MNIISNELQIAKTFSASFLIKLMNGRNIDLFIDTYKNSYFYKKNHTPRIKDVLNSYYSFLLEYYKNEYVYKNLLISHIKKHEDNNLYSIITEKNVGKNSRADLSIFSNTSTAYEIKTDLDTLYRLDKQLVDYSTAFEHVYVLTTEKRLKAIENKIDNRFGIKVLNSSNKIETFRKSITNKEHLTHTGIYSLLKQNEILQLLRKHYGFVPYDFSTVTSRKEIINLFISIDIEKCHYYAVEILKYRMKYSKVMSILEKIPSSLISIGLNNQIQKESKTFLNFLDLHLEELNHHIRMMQHGKLF